MILGDRLPYFLDLVNTNRFTLRSIILLNFRQEDILPLLVFSTSLVSLVSVLLPNFIILIDFVYNVGFAKILLGLVN